MQSQEQPETQTSAEVYPKDLVESEVRQRLQAQISRVIDDVVDDAADDPKPPKQPKQPAAKSVKSSKKAKRVATAEQPKSERDLWIALGVVCIVFVLLMSSLYNRISVLEKVIFESRV
jgi:hypothetical protein